MYERFYGLIRLPFQLLPDPDFFYRSREHDRALNSLEYGVFERAGFIVITGEIGTGKTTLLRNLLRSLNQDIPIALLNQTFLQPEDFLRTLCQEFSLPYEAKAKSELIEIFGTFLVDQYKEDRYVILILDEAQNLPLDTLEEIRMLSNLDADSERLLQIILVGQPSLRSKLQREGLRQLLQRVEVSYHLEPLGREEIQEYIHYRLSTAGAEDPELFDDSAVEAIFDCTGGVPRLINLICHRCLVYGFADSQKKISRDLVMKVLDDRKSEGLYPETIIESSTQDQEVIDEPSNFEKTSEAVISQEHFAAALNRLAEISGESMKAVELAAAKAVNRSDEEHLTLLKKKLAEERELREELELRLTRTENDLARLVKYPPEIVHEDQHPNSADTESSSDAQSKLGVIENYRSIFSVKPGRRYIFLLFFLIVIFSFVSVALWPPDKSDVNEQAPERKSAVFKMKIPQPNAKTENINPSMTPPEKPFAAQANSTSQTSDVQTSHSGDYKDQNEIKDESLEDLLLPETVPPEKLTIGEPVLSAEDKHKIYKCIVNSANVRAGPNMKAPVVKIITQGTEVEVIGEKGNWMQLKSEDGNSAWIYGTLLRRQN